jgi:hypothetical protein
MKRKNSLKCGVLGAVGALLVGTALVSARQEPLPSQFKYAAGTEDVAEGCLGDLEVSAEGMTFKCPGGSITAPFSAIRLMQYRSDVSRKIRRMKLKWKVRPDFVTPLFPVKHNRFFSVVFHTEGKSHVMVLRVSPEAMRPYLAEIDLRAGRRVDVESYEEY